MKITILFWGVLTEVTQEQQIDLEVDSTTNLLQLKEQLIRQYPDLIKYHHQIAVNQDLAQIEEELVLKEGDEIALMPPYAGG